MTAGPTRLFSDPESLLRQQPPAKVGDKPTSLSNRPPVTSPEEFSQKLKEFEVEAKKRGLTDAQIKSFLGHIDRLIDTDKPPKEALPIQLRKEIAFQILSNAVRPTDIDQGSHGTCAVAALEARLYTIHPDQAARLVTDVALNGKYVTTLGGKEIPANMEALIAPEADPLALHGAGRNYASQLFQSTAMNVFCVPRNGLYLHFPLGGSEVILDKSSGVPEIVGTSGMDIKGLVEIAEEITGLQNKAFLVHRKPELDYKDIPTKIESSEQLQKLLEDIKSGNSDQKFPLIAGVHTSSPRFPNHYAGGGWHAVCITDYDPATGRVFVDNFWGRKNDYLGEKGTLPCFTVNELFDAMTPSPNAKKDPNEPDFTDYLLAATIGGIFLLGAASAGRLLRQLTQKTFAQARDQFWPNRSATGETTKAAETTGIMQEAGKSLEVDPKTVERVLSELPRDFSAADLKAKLEELAARESAKAADTGGDTTSLGKELLKLHERTADLLELSRIHERLTASQGKLEAARLSPTTPVVPGQPLVRIGGEIGGIRDGIPVATVTGEVPELPKEYREAVDREVERLRKELIRLDERIKAEPDNKTLQAERLIAETQLSSMNRVVAEPGMRAKALEWIGKNGPTAAKAIGAVALIVYIYSLSTPRASGAEPLKHAKIKKQ